LFDSVEPNSQLKLYEYLDESKRQYEIAKREFMYKNYDSLFDLFNKRILTEGRKIQMFTSMKSLIEKLFSHPMLRKILQFQTVLLGTDPSKTPGLYRLMNYVDFDLGIWYPHGGISKLPESLSSIASKHGTNIYTNSPVRKIIVTDDGRATGVELEDGTVHTADIVVSNADIHFTEQKLLDEKWRDHSEKYWESKTLAPSAFIMYIGTSKQFPSLTHHNLLFTKDWNKNFKEVFGGTTFPSDPSLYVCTPSKTDDTVAPQGKENIFVLVPISPYVAYTDTDLEQWKEYTLEKMEKEMGMSGLRESIEHMRIYCTKDFAHDYNSFKGSALGLAHTLTQTAFFRANNVSQKVQNLYFVGAGTNPGIGMPICMISAEMAYKRIEGITDPEPLKSL
jgi:phytoene desaturase